MIEDRKTRHKSMSVPEIIVRGEIDECDQPYTYYKSEAYFDRGNEIEVLQNAIQGMEMHVEMLADMIKDKNKQLKAYEKEVRSLLQAGK
jgi:translation initiation factor IF-3